MKINIHRFKGLAACFALGAVVTIALCVLSINFYAEDFDQRERNPNHIIRFFHRLDQMTLDWRTRLRGPRKGSDQVAVLAVDEKSLAQEGQWPWPREKFKHLIERLVEGGAKVIAFDIVWSEKEQNAAVYTLAQLKKEVPQPEVRRLIEQKMSGAAYDQVLGAAVGKYAGNLVMGSFFHPPPYGFERPDEGYKNLCFEEVYLQQNSAALWSQQDPVFSVLDQTLVDLSDELPSAWRALLGEIFRAIDEKLEKEFLSSRGGVGGQGAVLGRTAVLELAQKAKIAKWEYCRRWLNEPSDQVPDPHYEKFIAVFAQAFADYELLAGLTPQEGLRLFKSKILNQKMTMVGEWTTNTEEISAQAVNTGFFNAKQDSDGTIRRSFLAVRSGRSYFPSLSLLTYLLATEQKVQMTVQHDISAVEGRGLFKYISAFELLNSEGEISGAVPVDKQGYLQINYAGPQLMFPHVSIADVLSEDPNITASTREFDPTMNEWVGVEKSLAKSEFYKDKIFVVGATATGIYDLRVTPFEEDFPGVEVHANVIDNLLRKDFLRRHAAEELAMLGFLFIFGLALSLFIGKFGAAVGALTVVVLLAATLWFDHVFFFGRGIIVSIFFPILLVLGIYVVLTTFKYFTEERNKKKLKGTFEKYVSPAIVNEILAHPDNIQLGGRKEHVTVFFSDVRGFTTMSEILSPTDLSDLLNEYLTPMTELIFANKGTLDKYIGDAIMAFFGAPLQFPDHANYACRAALQNVARLKVLQDELKRRELPHIDIGIGLNTGDVCVGNMGSNIVRNYTIMGDAVNLGARLEGITKEYGAKIIISEFTKREISAEFITREVDCVRVKGKKEPVRIHELLGDQELAPDLHAAVQLFNQGYQLYHQKQWASALALFEQAQLVRQGGDGSSRLYAERCRGYMEDPPAADWDGVFTMKTK